MKDTYGATKISVSRPIAREIKQAAGDKDYEVITKDIMSHLLMNNLIESEVVSIQHEELPSGDERMSIEFVVISVEDYKRLINQLKSKV